MISINGIKSSSLFLVALMGSMTAASLFISKKKRQITSENSIEKDQDDTNEDEEHTSSPNTVIVTLPPWAQTKMIEEYSKTSYPTDEDKMRLAISISHINSLIEKTGGPFGAAIFYKSQLIAIGMNQVVNLSNSTLHGETVAIQMAQKQCGTFSLLQWSPPASCIPIEREEEEEEKKMDERKKPPVLELFTSCDPCAMCLGATLWSGVGRLVCGATKNDAMAIGFDEGPVFEESYRYLEDRGIEVKRGVLQKEAAKVLQEYGKQGIIYNRE